MCPRVGRRFLQQVPQAEAAARVLGERRERGGAAPAGGQPGRARRGAAPHPGLEARREALRPRGALLVHGV